MWKGRSSEDEGRRELKSFPAPQPLLCGYRNNRPPYNSTLARQRQEPNMAEFLDYSAQLQRVSSRISSSKSELRRQTRDDTA